MNLAVEVYEARLPMNKAFAHATKARHASESVLLVLSLADVSGCGEAAPRDYVTGETVDSVVAALSRLDYAGLLERIKMEAFEQSVLALADADLPRMLGGARPMHAAACAVETALLDLICRLHGRPIREAISLVVPARSASLGPERSLVIVEACDLNWSEQDLRRRIAGRKASALHIKLKCDSALERSVASVARLRQIVGGASRLSLDCNGSWTLGMLRKAGAQLARDSVAWIEEPLAARRWDDLRCIRSDLGLAVMLDESCVDQADLEAAVAAEACDLVNVRLSKCGGPLKAARLAEAARARGIGYQIGVQVGEVGPLWATSRALATVLRDAVCVECGRQDEWFDGALTDPAYWIDRANALAPTLPGPGHGLTMGTPFWTTASKAFEMKASAHA